MEFKMNAAPAVISILARNLADLCQKYPKAGVFIESHWTEEQCHDYISRLLTDVRNGERIGFEAEIYEKLIKIYAIHVSMYGDYGKPLTISVPNINIHT
jgi:hypothetical protein